MKNIFKSTAVMMTFICFATTTYARGGEHGERGRKRIFKQLNLSEEQMAKIKNMRKVSKEEMKSTRGEIKSLRKEMKEAFKSGASEDKLRVIHGKIRTLKGKKDEMRFEKMLKIRSILNAEQRKKFHELKEQMRSERKGRRGRHHRGGDEE